MEQIRLELEEKQNAKERVKQERQFQIEVITLCTLLLIQKYFPDSDWQKQTHNSP